jgi:hypothetical protein
MADECPDCGLRPEQDGNPSPKRVCSVCGKGIWVANHQRRALEMTPDKALADLKDNCDHFVDAPPNCWYCEVAAVITEQQSKLDQIRQILEHADLTKRVLGELQKIVTPRSRPEA